MPTPKALPTSSITGLEIFAAGKWNNDSYSEADLDSMIAAFPKVGFSPIIKAGHQDGQESSAKRLFGEPSLGTVSRIYRKGTKLLADIVNIPARFAALIKAGSYKRVSSEIFWNYKMGEQTFPRVLKGVAFLGADIPALTNLTAIESLFGKNAHVVTYALKPFTAERTYHSMDQNFSELLAQYNAGDEQAALEVDTRVKQRMSETGKDYSTALYSLRDEARVKKYTGDGPIGRQPENQETLTRRYTSGVQLDARAKDIALARSIGYTQALRIAMMESPDSARDYSGYEVSREYASKLGINALANICSHCTNDDMTMDWDQALDAALAEPEACQKAASERIVQLTDRMIALEGIPGSEVNAGGREEMRRRVLDQYPALAAAAVDGSALTVDALRQILWTRK